MALFPEKSFVWDNKKLLATRKVNSSGIKSGNRCSAATFFESLKGCESNKKDPASLIPVSLEAQKANFTGN